MSREDDLATAQANHTDWTMTDVTGIYLRADIGVYVWVQPDPYSDDNFAVLWADTYTGGVAVTDPLTSAQPQLSSTASTAEAAFEDAERVWRDVFATRSYQNPPLITGGGMWPPPDPTEPA